MYFIKSRKSGLGSLSFCAVTALVVSWACAPTSQNPEGDVDADADEKAGDGDGDLMLPLGDGDGDGIIIPQPSSDAFPAEPVFEAGVDPAGVTVFDNPDDFVPGVCVHEPHLSDERGPGALFPINWLRPRFRWTGTGAETLWEIRLTATSQTNALKIYTTQTNWTMPKELWEKVATGVQDDITVTVRGVGGSGTVGMRGNFRVTPALAGGAMVFWGTSSSVVAAGTSSLFGFTMGDEAVVNTLNSGQVASISNVIGATGSDLRGDKVSDAVTGFEPGQARCIGCHSATPDGAAMIFTDDYPWNMGIASVAEGTTGAAPDYLTAGGQQFLKMPFLGTGAMLPAAWESGDRTLIATMGRRAANIYINYGYNEPKTYEPLLHDLVWIDLSTTASYNETLPAAEGVTGNPPWAVDYTGYQRAEAALARDAEIRAASGTAYGVLTTETGSISNPSPAKTALRVAYSVSESSIDGHPDWHNNTSDIKIVDLTSPRAATGAGVAVAGASDPAFLEYYPAFSPDDAFLAFTRAAAPTNATRCRQGNPVVQTEPDGAICDNFTKDLGANPDGPYYNRNGEIFIVPSAGGTPHRLRGNDPVMCGGEASPGVLNSWPKWSSKVREYEGKNYYFIIFSSARAYEGQFDLTPTSYTPPILTKSSHLYMSVVVHDPATGEIVSYAPIYLWNQNYLATGPDTYEPLLTANLTPAWEDFSIPAVPPVVVVK